MHDKKPMTEPTALDGGKLWDEILKAIVSAYGKRVNRVRGKRYIDIK